MNRLACLFDPQSVAIVGASPNGTPAEVLSNLERMGFTGDIVLVNPLRSSIGDRPCHASLAASGKAVDVAAICVRASRAVDALRDAVAAGARSAVVFADGFSAGDPDGPALQDELVAVAAEAGIPVLGPNAMGYLAPALGKALYIDHIGRVPEAGSIGLITQSGSVGVAGINHTGTLRLSAMISVGNEAVVGMADCIDFLASDPATGVVAIFAEGIKDGHALVGATRRSVAAGVPVVVCKTGRSPAAIRAAQSHTGAMANDQLVVRAFLEAAGAAVVDDIDEMFAAAELLASKRRIGPRLAAVTLSGGHVGLLEDMAHNHDLQFFQPVPPSHQRIEAHLGGHRAVVNPLDCWINDDVSAAIQRGADALAELPEIDAFLFAVDTPADPPTSFVQMGRSIAKVAVELAARDPRLVIMQSTTIAAEDPEVTVCLRQGGVHRLSGLKATFAAWNAILRAQAASTPVASQPSPCAGLQEGTEAQIYANLSAAGIALPRYRVCSDAGEAVEAAKDIGLPVVVKVLGAGIIHKTELGGVAVGLDTPEAVEAAGHRMLAIPGATGILVAEMAQPGLDAFVGAKTDESFGPLVLVGMGGTQAELFGDIAVLPAPTTPDAVAAALDKLKFGQLLKGYRGAQAVDTTALAAVATSLSTMICASSPHLSVDLNPVRLVGQKAIVLDAKVSMRPA